MLLTTNLSNAFDGVPNEATVYSFLAQYTSFVNCVLLVLTVLVLYILHDMNKQSPGCAPPTLWRLPIVGNLPQIGTSPHLAFTRIGKDLGEVFSLRLGSWDVLIINSLAAAKEVFVQKSAYFSSRPPFHSLRLGGAHEYSVSFGDYNPLQVQRKKALLKVFHQAILTNPEHLNHILSLETSRMNEVLLDTGGSPFDPRACLKLVVGRLVFHLVFGGPVGEEVDRDLINLSKQSRKFQEKANAAILADFMPWLRFALKGPVAKLEGSVEILKAFVQKAYRQRKDGYKLDKAEFCVARAMAAYVASERRQMKKTIGTSSSSSSTNEESERQEVKDDTELNTKKERLVDFQGKDTRGKNSEGKAEELTKEEENAIEQQVVTMLAPDAIGAGSENIGSTFCWTLAFISSYEELQQDLHAELDGVVGKNREPCIQDKQHMPLMQATILEALRLSSAIPLSLPHYCVEDSVVKGYSVAKGTVVLTNIWGINHDDRHFSHPDCFEPYRFLDSSGSLRGDRCSLAMTFNIGPRSCAGNAVTKTVLFVLLSSIIQKFDLRSSKDLTRSLGAMPGPILSPDAFEVRFCPRE